MTIDHTRKGKTDLLVVAGAPGSGKTTIARLLHAELDGAFIDLGHLREFHLDNEWSNASPREEGMAFENLLYIVRNYFRHGYAPVIVTDLRDFRVQEMPVHLGLWRRFWLWLRVPERRQRN